MYKKMPVIALEEHYWDHELAAQLQGADGARSPDLLKRLYDLGELRPARAIAKLELETENVFIKRHRPIHVLDGVIDALNPLEHVSLPCFSFAPQAARPLRH